MNSNDELYNFIEDLINWLDCNGEDEFAIFLKTSLNGSVGTEIFMALRYYLNNLKKSGIKLPEQIREKIDEAITTINKELSL